MLPAPPEPAATDKGIISAHLAAFAFEAVRDLHGKWRQATQAIESELDKFHHPEPIWENLDAEVQMDDLKKLRKMLIPAEQEARQALCDRIAQELSHRKRDDSSRRTRRQLPWRR